MYKEGQGLCDMKEEQEKKELEQASEYSFIKEKIKERPKNKKKIHLQHNNDNSPQNALFFDDRW